MTSRKLPQHLEAELAARSILDKQGPYYHASAEPLPVGEVLVARGYQGSRSELLDSRRPQGVAPRSENLFMVTDRDCLPQLGQKDKPYVYRVTPAGPVTKGNFEWFQRALFYSPNRMSEGDVEKAAGAADKYWSGLPGEHPCWDEYLTRSFKIEERV